MELYRFGIAERIPLNVVTSGGIDRARYIVKKVCAKEGLNEADFRSCLYPVEFNGTLNLGYWVDEGRLAQRFGLRKVVIL